MFRLESIELSEFKSYVGTHCIDFSLFGPSVVYVKGRNDLAPELGSNGAGKSTLWDALVWALYGKTARGLRNPDVRAWHGGKTTSVKVKFQSKKGTHVVKRTANPNKLTLDGEDFDQESLDSLIGMSYSVFMNTVVLGQFGKLFLDLSPTEKLDLFTEILDLDKWERRSKYASERAAKVDQKIADLESQKRTKMSFLGDLETKIEKAQAKADSFDKEILSKLEEIRAKKEDLEKQLFSAEDFLSKIQVEDDSSSLRAEEFRSEEFKLRSRVEKGKDSVSDIKAEIRVLDSEITKLQKEINALLGDSDGDYVCPTCGQSLEGTDLKEQIQKMEVDLSAKLEKRFELQDNLVKYGKKLKGLEDKLEEVSDKIESIESEDRKRRNKLVTAGSNVERLKHSVWAADAEIQKLEKSENIYSEQVRSLKRDKKKMELSIKELDEAISTKRDVLERIQYWVKGFKDVKLYVAEDVISELNDITESMLSDVGLIGWSMEFIVEKETKAGTVKRGMDVLVRSPVMSDPVRWESWSGGESQRLRLVGTLAFSEVLLSYVGVWPDIEILDEPSQHLSSEGVRDLCEFLSHRARDTGKRILYTDHQALESMHFGGSITVVKGDEGSYIEDISVG